MAANQMHYSSSSQTYGYHSVYTQRGADLPFGFRIVLPDAEKQRIPVFRNQNPGCVYLSGADEE